MGVFRFQGSLAHLTPFRLRCCLRRFHIQERSSSARHCSYQRRSVSISMYTPTPTSPHLTSTLQCLHPRISISLSLLVQHSPMYPPTNNETARFPVQQGDWATAEMKGLALASSSSSQLWVLLNGVNALRNSSSLPFLPRISFHPIRA